MEKKFSVKFRKDFLNRLTKELVKNSGGREMAKLKNIENAFERLNDFFNSQKKKHLNKKLNQK